MIKWGFRDSTGTLVSPSDVDRMVCRDFDVDYAEEEFSMWFVFMTHVGNRVLQEGRWDRDEFEATFGQLREKHGDRFVRFDVDSIKDRFEHYLHGEYVYECYR
jgi:hypothetical protein